MKGARFWVAANNDPKNISKPFDWNAIYDNRNFQAKEFTDAVGALGEVQDPKANYIAESEEDAQTMGNYYAEFRSVKERALNAAVEDKDILTLKSSVARLKSMSAEAANPLTDVGRRFAAFTERERVDAQIDGETGYTDYQREYWKDKGLVKYLANQQISPGDASGYAYQGADAPEWVDVATAVNNFAQTAKEWSAESGPMRTEYGLKSVTSAWTKNKDLFNNGLKATYGDSKINAMVEFDAEALVNKFAKTGKLPGNAGEAIQMMTTKLQRQSGDGKTLVDQQNDDGSLVGTEIENLMRAGVIKSKTIDELMQNKQELKLVIDRGLRLGYAQRAANQYDVSRTSVDITQDAYSTAYGNTKGAYAANLEIEKQLAKMNRYRVADKSVNNVDPALERVNGILGNITTGNLVGGMFKRSSSPMLGVGRAVDGIIVNKSTTFDEIEAVYAKSGNKEDLAVIRDAKNWWNTANKGKNKSGKATNFVGRDAAGGDVGTGPDYVSVGKNYTSEQILKAYAEHKASTQQINSFQILSGQQREQWTNTIMGQFDTGEDGSTADAAGNAAHMYVIDNGKKMPVAEYVTKEFDGDYKAFRKAYSVQGINGEVKTRDSNGNLKFGKAHHLVMNGDASKGLILVDNIAEYDAMVRGVNNAQTDLSRGSGMSDFNAYDVNGRAYKVTQQLETEVKEDAEGNPYVATTAKYYSGGKLIKTEYSHPTEGQDKAGTFIADVHGDVSEQFNNAPKHKDMSNQGDVAVLGNDITFKKEPKFNAVTGKYE